MPAAIVTCLAIALSMLTAEPSTPLPTYGTPASSSMPCTVPSSPNGPCRRGSTTVRPVRLVASASIGVGDTEVPDGSSRPGSACGPTVNAADASAASAHCPPVEMPIGVMR
jgi:hypothetical protein